MPAFAGKNFTDTELLNRAKKALYQRTRLLSPEATLAAIQDLKLWVSEELSFEEAASTSFGRVLSELWHAEYLDQLPPLLNKFERLASAYFVRRGSVTAFHGFCNAWREGVLRRVLLFAEEGLEVSEQGHPPAPYALLASGTLGRREQTMEDSDPYFLVWSKGDARYFEPFSYRIMAILDQLGLIGKDGSGTVARLLWRGALTKWELFPETESEVHDSATRLQLLSDLRFICGDETVGNEAVAIARSAVRSSWGKTNLEKLAAEAASAQIALGPFGGIRVETSGDQKGGFNLARHALSPLVAGVTVLALRHDLEPAPTLERLAALGALGVLEQELVDRLEAGYHQLASLKVSREIALEQPYLDPAELSVLEQRNVKAALEAVRQLQRVIRARQLVKAPVTEMDEDVDVGIDCDATVPNSPSPL